MNTYHITENNSGGYMVTPHRHGNPYVVDARTENEAIASFELFHRIHWDVQNTYGPGGNSCECCGVRFFIEQIVDEHERAFDLYLLYI